MIVLALLPPLWRRVMDPRVLAHEIGHAMTLQHNGIHSTLMFHGAAGLGSILMRHEIDTINPTGTITS